MRMDVFCSRSGRIDPTEGGQAGSGRCHHGGAGPFRMCTLARFTQDILCALATFAALGGYAQPLAQLAHGADTFLAHDAMDVRIGNVMAQADVHGASLR